MKNIELIFSPEHNGKIVKGINHLLHLLKKHNGVIARGITPKIHNEKKHNGVIAFGIPVKEKEKVRIA